MGYRELFLVKPIIPGAMVCSTIGDIQNGPALLGPVRFSTGFGAPQRSRAECLTKFTFKLPSDSYIDFIK